MRGFQHINARSVEEAVSALAEHRSNASVIAGGQDLLFRIKKFIVQPSYLVNLKTIPGLSSIRTEADGELRIGALTTLSNIAASAEIQRQYSVLAQAAGSVGSPQIRNMGTIGGNICQDVWCWYLQDGFSCWKSGGRFCDLAAGDSRYYGSIMGGHLCLANHPSDTAPALAALDARLRLASAQGQREVSILELLSGHTWVGGTLQPHNLRQGEIITDIALLFRPNRSVYVKFALRKSWDFAICSAAVSAVVNQGIFEDVRIVVGGVATFPYRDERAELLIKGRRISENLASEAAECALSNARPLAMNRYKLDLSKVLVRRALLSLGGN